MMLAMLRPAPRLPSLLRLYATTATDPYTWPTTVNPTPYEVLSHRKHGPYSKHHYLELAKLYHPDHHHHHHFPGAPPHTTRLERFRLIVAAHTLLSDPAARSSYDRFGAGWDLPHPVQHRRSSPTPYDRSHSRSRQHEKWWNAREGHSPRTDPTHNATWEDWERWYAAQDPSAATAMGKQQELYTKNGTFLGWLLALAAVGSFLELGYATSVGSGMDEVRDKRDVDLSEDMRRRRRDAREQMGLELAGRDIRDEKIKKFLITRDPEGYGKALPPPPRALPPPRRDGVD